MEKYSPIPSLQFSIKTEILHLYSTVQANATGWETKKTKKGIHAGAEVESSSELTVLLIRREVKKERGFYNVYVALEKWVVLISLSLSISQ